MRYEWRCPAYRSCGNPFKDKILIDRMVRKMKEKKNGWVKYKSKFQGFDIDAFKNTKTGEEYFDPDQAENILLFNKLREKSFKTKAGKIQSNIIIRLPVEVSNSLNIKKGEKVNIRVEGRNKLVLEI